jgi:hypothetical protein
MFLGTTNLEFFKKIIEMEFWKCSEEKRVLYFFTEEAIYLPDVQFIAALQKQICTKMLFLENKQKPMFSIHVRT